METTTRYAVAIPDEEYDAIVKKVRKEGRIGFRSVDKNGIHHRFYYSDDKLLVDIRTDDTTTTKDVMKLSDALEEQKKQGEQADRDFKEYITGVLRKDNPEMEDDMIEAYADILTQANQSVKNLMARGHNPDTALEIVQSILEIKNNVEFFNKLSSISDQRGIEMREDYEDKMKHNNGTAIGEVLRDRERLFGNPKDENYGKD